VTFSTLF
jgi:hypothetical protein